ncbi:hypothetical protein AVEN_107478-1 [Araneus ventricosus]|uniref:Uncharacterized protein n=1 Tax=Araneus ventricosus TaxID=182803 RepID=A0A4Y2N641_ARAVE|nr:hypothetical protein AVEN_107478-1 [Araneus ventricosus]
MFKYNITVSTLHGFHGQDQDNPEEREEEEVSTDLVSHSNAASAFELALRYVEQHADATPTDVMFMGALAQSAATIGCTKWEGRTTNL